MVLLKVLLLLVVVQANAAARCPRRFKCTGDDDCKDKNKRTVCVKEQKNNGELRKTGCCRRDPCEKASCDVNAVCTSTNGVATCACKPGYTGDGVTCMPVDPCSPSPCGANADCTTTGDGRPVCSCPAGYEGNPFEVCRDVDECSAGNNNCDANAICTNTDGSFACQCKPGYIGDGVTCMPVVPCSPSPCGANADCTTTGDGRPVCSCPAGYTGDPLVVCRDVDECSAGNNNCDPNAICINTDGSFVCQCMDGFTGDGVTCMPVPVDLCSPSPCGANADCITRNGRAVCSCPVGYEGDPLVSCRDVDECSAGNNNCGPNAICINTDGSFVCQCMDGFTGDGVTCVPVPVDPCSPSPCGTNADCTNRDGRAVCSCPAGFVGNPLVSCVMA